MSVEGRADPILGLAFVMALGCLGRAGISSTMVKVERTPSRACEIKQFLAYTEYP
jgi:hypothetical protein